MAQADSIRLALKAQPFRPFDLKMVDGAIYRIRHPDWVSISPARRPREAIVYTPANVGDDEYDAHWLDLGLISEIIVPASGATPPAQPDPDGE